uniref:Uncharacterized protein n=1 Tax=Plectus sambesii TaxID=2011161 RepID=A0A914XEP2_9BILA
MEVDDANNSVEDMDVDNVHHDANDYVEDMDVDDVRDNANDYIEDMDVDDDDSNSSNNVEEMEVDNVDGLLSVVSNPGCLKTTGKRTSQDHHSTFNILCSTSGMAASMPCYLKKIATVYLLVLRAQVASAGVDFSSNIQVVNC